MSKIHYPWKSHKLGLLCNRVISPYVTQQEATSKDWEKVTCKFCQKLRPRIVRAGL